ncbi:hypothetical protein DPMN_157734 [Dreissena polymorpha]|uniref:Uncharacterized protein n=1 Tax=Dreissena polymorpha TaxID=45954 RepID=A0A9D4EKX5_DREPO|nr:hypothetical protein DPMN_157734 [Dreissena polymorpha]
MILTWKTRCICTMQNTYIRRMGIHRLMTLKRLHHCNFRKPTLLAIIVRQLEMSEKSIEQAYD